MIDHRVECIMIKKIVIEMESGDTIKLSAVEARQLYNELYELFGAPVLPYSPLVPYPYPPSEPYQPQITWTGDRSDIQPNTTTSKVQ